VQCRHGRGILGTNIEGNVAGPKLNKPQIVRPFGRPMQERVTLVVGIFGQTLVFDPVGALELLPGLDNVGHERVIAHFGQDSERLDKFLRTLIAYQIGRCFLERNAGTDGGRGVIGTAGSARGCSVIVLMTVTVRVSVRMTLCLLLLLLHHELLETLLLQELLLLLL